MKKYLLIFLMPFLFFGCAAPQMYYWGDYSSSLHRCRKDAKEENVLKHKQVLENIVAESQTRNLRVPPGVYAELGYIYLRENKGSEATKYFELEAQIYPESKIFMDRLTQAAKAKNQDSENKTGLPKKD